MAGRSFWTIPLSCDAVGNNMKQGISVYANGTAKVKSATVYAVKSIWAKDARDAVVNLKEQSHCISQLREH